MRVIFQSGRVPRYGGGGKRGGEQSEEVGGGCRLRNKKLMGQGEKKLRKKYTTCQNQPRTPEGCQVVRSQEASSQPFTYSCLMFPAWISSIRYKYRLYFTDTSLVCANSTCPVVVQYTEVLPISATS